MDTQKTRLETLEDAKEYAEIAAWVAEVDGRKPKIFIEIVRDESGGRPDEYYVVEVE